MPVNNRTSASEDMYIRKIDIISKLFYYFSTIYFKKNTADKGNFPPLDS